MDESAWIAIKVVGVNGDFPLDMSKVILVHYSPWISYTSLQVRSCFLGMLFASL